MRTVFRYLAWTSLAAAAWPLLAQEAAIRQVLAAQTAAWNRGDVKAFMEGYEDAATTTFVGKKVTRGFANVLADYVKRYPSKEAMGTVSFRDIEIHPLGTDHAWVLGRFALARPASAGGASGGWFTLLFRKTAKGWRIIVDHTS